MNQIEGIIFDWAGTTVDFGCFAPVNVFVEIFKNAGIEVTMSEARLPMGMLKIDHIKAMLEMPRIGDLWKEKYGRAFTQEDVNTLYASFEPMLLQSLSNYCEPIEHVVETVQKLREKGLKIGSTTGYNDKMMAIVTEGAGQKGYKPDFWITPDSTSGCGRPYPYMVYHNMEGLKLTAPWRVIKVGDTYADINEGVQAGVWSVGVVIGSSQMGLDKSEFEALSPNEQEEIILRVEQEFLNKGADFTIRTMEELPKLVETINELLEKGVRP